MIRLIKLSLSVFFLFSIFLSSSLVLLPSSFVEAAVPHLINYQGRLTDKDNKPLDGAYNINFKIYDAENAGNLLWQETQSSVLIQKGIFSIMLGSVTNLDLSFDKPYFLEIKVNDEVMSPRQRITSSGYAFMAENVLSIPRGVIVVWSGTIASIPSGWALCDGTNGTPDLRDRFIVGAGSSYGVAQTGGEASHVLTVSEMPPHTHSGSFADQREDSEGDDTEYYVNKGLTSSTGSTGGGQPHNNLPPYYALAYIMKL